MEENNLTLTSADKYNLSETARWGKFLGIVGFVFSGLVIVVGLAMFGGTLGDMYPGLGGGIGFIYILMSLIYIFPSLYVYRFSTQIKKGIAGNDQANCTEAYNNLRRLFLFMGVLTIIGIALYAIVIFGIIIGGAMGGML